MDEADNDVLCNDSDVDGNFRGVRKMKALTVKLEQVTLSGKGR
jgi:hypothetical protein